MKSIQNTIKTSIWLSLCLMFTLISACKKDDAVKDLGVAPTSEQVKFSNTPTSANANIINFKNKSQPLEPSGILEMEQLPKETTYKHRTL